jgi:hypothetical protein
VLSALPLDLPALGRQSATALEVRLAEVVAGRRASSKAGGAGVGFGKV